MNQATIKSFAGIFLIAAVAASCKKNLATQKAETTIGNSAQSSGPIIVPPYTWSALVTPDNTVYPTNNPKIPIFTVPVGSTWYAFSGDCLEVAFKLNTSTMRWARQPSYGSNFCLFSDSRYFFTYQSKLYYGFAGADLGAFGSFDPVTGLRTTLARFPGVDSIGAAQFFVVGDNGYIFYGGDYASSWKYNFSANQWTKMGHSPAGKRYSAITIVVDDKVYIGMGWESVTSGGTSYRSYRNDWKLFTPATWSQTTKAAFAGLPRGNAHGFVIGSNIFLGFGYYYNPNNNPQTVRRTDWWKYNVSSDTWGQATSFPGELVTGKVSEYGNLAAFAQGNAGYVVTGGINGFWRWANTPLITQQ